MPDLTFQQNDKFQREPFAHQLTKAIVRFSPFTDGAYVLSLNAPFGSGKTTFLKMWEAYLKQEQFTVISINAWETDYANDPILPIASAFLEALPKTNKKLKDTFHTVIGTTALIGNTVLKAATGGQIDAKEIAQNVEDDLNSKSIIARGKNLYEAFNFKQSVYASLHDELKKYVNDLAMKPLVILIDELDRARPNYSIEFLETIKHLFSVKGLCFVLAVDRWQLESSAKQLFGANLDFQRYYRRFITREVNLPSINDLPLTPFITHLFKDFFEAKAHAGLKFAFDSNQQDNIIREIEIICRGFGLKPRDIEHVCRILNHFWAVERKDNRAADPWYRMAIFMAALLVVNNEVYHKIGTDNFGTDDFNRLIGTMHFPNEDYPYDKRTVLFDALAFSCTSQIVRNSDSPKAKKICELVRQMEKDFSRGNDRELSDSEILTMLNSTVRFQRQSGFRHLYERIEHWKPFFDN